MWIFYKIVSFKIYYPRCDVELGVTFYTLTYATKSSQKFELSLPNVEVCFWQPEWLAFQVHVSWMYVMKQIVYRLT
jgi:hypothetical protein